MLFLLLLDFLNNQLHTMANLHNLHHHCDVLYWVFPFMCIYFLCKKQLCVKVLPQVLWLFFCLSVGYLFDCPFLSWMRTICTMKLLLFLIMCLINVHHGLWFVPDNVWQIKSAIFLTFYYWIVVAPIFIEFTYN